MNGNGRAVRIFVYQCCGRERKAAATPTCSMDEQEDEEEKLCYRQRAEKAAGGEVTLMQWSPTMDVIALAFKDHSVIKHGDN